MSAFLGVQYVHVVPWLIVAAVSLAAWGVLFGVIAVTTMPRLPKAGADTMDLREEPPAVVNFLVNRCEVTSSAVAATLVDLAARKVVAIEEIGDGRQLIRVHGNDADARNEYERRVFDLVSQRASNGTVPAEELSLGSGPLAEVAWKSFRRAVVDHARELGLARARFGGTQRAILTVTFIVPSALAGAAFESYGAALRDAGDNTFKSGSGFWFAVLMWALGLTAGAAILRGSRETRAGSVAIAHWLGVRNYLRGQKAFADVSAAGVVIWERLLSYGIALGVAHAADASLPIGPPRNTDGWSPYSGLWRHVRIRYPKRVGYGTAPGRAIRLCFIGLGGATLTLLIFARFTVSAFEELGDTGGTHGATRWALFAGTLFMMIPGIAVCVVALGALVFLPRAFADLHETQTFEGYVVRVPWVRRRDSNGSSLVPMGYTAVDDGHDNEIRALRYYDPNVSEGEFVRVTMTPRLHHVVRMEPTPQKGAPT